ncbi:MAG: hypothetical protein AAF456_09375 [Planctomycetota bacterium]
MAAKRSETRQGTDYWILAASFVPAAALTWTIHELAHYFAGMLLGYDMWVSINQAGPVNGSFDSDTHSVIVAMAGPVITWLQGIVAYVVVRWSRELWTYSFIFLTFWMRSVAMIISFIAHPNDEAKASLLMNLPMWVLPAISTCLLLVFTFLAARELKAGWRENLIAFVASSVATAAIVFADQLLF